jgi:hypothetical protein
MVCCVPVFDNMFLFSGHKNVMAGYGFVIPDYGFADPEDIFTDPQHFCSGTLLHMYRCCYLPYVVVIPVGLVTQFL